VKRNILDYPPYSPDLGPSDFYLFIHPKKHLAGKKFDDDDEVQKEVMTWFKGLVVDFCGTGIQKLFPRLNKCLDNAGDYVKKYNYVQALHSQCRFCKLKILYMFKTFVPLLSGHASQHCLPLPVIALLRTSRRSGGQGTAGTR